MNQLKRFIAQVLAKLLHKGEQAIKPIKIMMTQRRGSVSSPHKQRITREAKNKILYG